jgi:phage/plasmid-associated DNA primase
MGLNKGAYYIEVDDEEQFMKLYNDAREKGADLDIVEKHRDQSHIVIDLDFRQDTQDRKYTEDMIIGFLSKVKEQIMEYLDVCDFKFFVMEKGIEARPNKSGGFKDGLHIVCPDIVTKPEVQYIIRNNILEKHMKDIFHDTFTNAYQDIYDEAVIHKNGWFLLGSKKPDEDNPWVVTKVYNVDLETIDNEYSDEELLSLLSIRNKFECVAVKDTKLEEVKAYKESMKKKTEKRSSCVNDGEVNTKSPSSNNTIDFDILRQIVMGLSPKRSVGYNNWTNSVWAIFNVCRQNGYMRQGRELIHEFSKQSPNEYNENRVEDFLYNDTKEMDDGLGLGSLIMWLEEDNEAEASRIKSILNPIKQIKLNGYSIIETEEGNTDDAYKIYCILKKCYHEEVTNDKIAQLMHLLDKSIIYVGDDVFYRQNEFGIYRELQCSTQKEYIIKQIKDVVNPLFIKKYWEYLKSKEVALKSLQDNNATKDMIDESMAEIKDLKRTFSKNKKSLEGILFCKQTYDAYKVHVLRHDAMKLMDACPHLIGFSNGVLDLNTMEFRNARSDEYVSITMCGKLRKQPKDITPADFSKWDDIINAWFKRQEDADHLKRLLGASLVKGNKEQAIYVLKNDGSCGKTILECGIASVFGDYFSRLPSSYYTSPPEDAERPNPLLYTLDKARVVWTNETSEHMKIYNEKYKMIGDGLSVFKVRTLHNKTYKNVQASFRPIISTNKDLIFNGDFGYAEARRTRILPFDYKFVTQKEIDEAYDKSKLKLKDDELENRIKTKEMIEEMIMLLVYYHQQYKDMGLLMTESMAKATTDFFATMDTVLAWRIDRCEKCSDEQTVVNVTDLYHDYMNFYQSECDENIFNIVKKMTEPKFRKALASQSYVIKRTKDHHRVDFYRVYGLKLKNEMDSNYAFRPDLEEVDALG